MKKTILFALLIFSVSFPAQAADLEFSPGLMTGSMAPDFAATTHEGESITLSKLIAEGPVVLVFYRGAWCPYCNLHLKSFQAKLAEIKAEGANVLGISIDLEEYANKTVIENGLGFQVLSDPSAEILAAYNLIFKVPAELASKYKNEYGIDLEKHSGRTDHVIAVPATYVINKESQIVFAYASKDYKTRTKPEEVLQVLRGLTN